MRARSLVWVADKVHPVFDAVLLAFVDIASQSSEKVCCYLNSLDDHSVSLFPRQGFSEMRIADAVDNTVGCVCQAG